MAGNFSLDLARFIEHADGNIDKALRQAVVVAAQSIIHDSPVDSGRFRANWMFGKEIPTGTVHAVDLSVDGKSTVRKIEAQTRGLKAGGECWLVNNLPYSGKLEYGYSQQAPNGMVRVALANLPAALDRIFRDPP